MAQQNFLSPFRYAVIIGVDGAGAFFKEAETPAFDRIFKKGAVTYNMLTSIPTISAECWGSLLHGVEPEKHGLTNRKCMEFPYPADSPYPSIFRVLRRVRPGARLGSFSCWPAINIGIVEEDLDVYKSNAPDPELTEQILEYLDGGIPDLLFVQLDHVDHEDTPLVTAQKNIFTLLPKPMKDTAGSMTNMPPQGCWMRLCSWWFQTTAVLRKRPTAAPVMLKRSSPLPPQGAISTGSVPLKRRKSETLPPSPLLLWEPPTLKHGPQRSPKGFLSEETVPFRPVAPYLTSAAAAVAAMPSPLPVKPSFSVVVALTEIRSAEMPMTSARRVCIAFL